MLWIQQFFLSCKLTTGLTISPIFILSSKNGKSLWSLCNFLRQLTSTSRKYHYIYYSFFMKSPVNWDVSSSLLQHCISVQIIYIPVLRIWYFFIYTIIFHVFVVSFWTLMNNMASSSSEPFSTINKISMFLNSSNLILYFSMLLAC